MDAPRLSIILSLPSREAGSVEKSPPPRRCRGTSFGRAANIWNPSCSTSRRSGVPEVCLSSVFSLTVQRRSLKRLGRRGMLRRGRLNCPGCWFRLPFLLCLRFSFHLLFRFRRGFGQPFPYSLQLLHPETAAPTNASEFLTFRRTPQSSPPAHSGASLPPRAGSARPHRS